MALTKRQHEVLEFIAQFLSENEYSPSFEEIAEGLGLASIATVHKHLTALESIRAVPYDLEYHGRWDVDLGSVRHATGPRTRIVLVVSPNNPTGSWLHADDLGALARLCAERRMALIGDEVFADYPLDPDPAAVSVLAMLPVIVLGVVAQKHIVKGLTVGAVKGGGRR